MSPTRFFSYAPNKYEFLKSTTWGVETFTVADDFIYLTSEQKAELAELGGAWGARIWAAPGSQWIPRYLYNGRASRRLCNGWVWFLREPSCASAYSTAGGCSVFPSEFYLAPYDFGPGYGVLDTLIKVDTADYGELVEKYYYAKGHGLMRWEMVRADGVLMNAGQIISEDQSEFVNPPCIEP